tara:strand:- start:25 stop:276 length:252 start_codon:yes stop_codon:yes gene_type:complete
MFKIDKIENENIYFTNGKMMWILYFKGFDYWGKTPKLSIEDSMKIGNAMREIGYGDSDVDEYREELRFEDIEEMYSNNVPTLL